MDDAPDSDEQQHQSTTVDDQTGANSDNKDTGLLGLGLQLNPTAKAIVMVTVVIVVISTRQCVCAFNPLTPSCCHMGTAIKHPVPHQVKPSIICNF